MTRRRPAANQKPIDFDRATRLKLRASVKLPPAEKFILWIIDDHIGNGRSWTMTSRQLAEESGYTERCVRKIVAALEKRSIVWTEHASDHYHDQRREFFIAWPNLAELIDEQSGQTEQPTEALPVDPEPCSTIRNNDLQSGTTFHDPEQRSAIRNVVPDSLYTKTAHCTAPVTAPSPPPSPDPERMAVMMAVKECGVGKFAEAVETATAQGMTLPQILAVVDFFRNHPGRWSPGVLFSRLTEPGASLNAPHEGWDGFRQNPGYRPPAPTEAPAQACDDLEAQHGATLDALDDAALEGLAVGLSLRDRRDLQTLGKNHPELRPRLLRLLARSLVEV